MSTTSSERLQYLVNVIPLKLEAMSEEELGHKYDENKWSKKELLGHLIDSAANNHQRFIRIRYEEMPTIVYNQDQWVALNFYQELGKKHLIGLWTLYNQHLVEVIRRIPEKDLLKQGRTNDTHTLQWLIDDYVAHLEHHLRQFVSY